MQAFTSSSHPAPRIVRALGAGVILALALIHIIPESVTELEALSEHMDRPYNVAGCTVVLGVLFMVLLDFVIHSAVDKQEHRPTLPAVSPKQPVAEALETITTRYDPHTHVCVGHQSALILDVVAARTRRDQVRFEAPSLCPYSTPTYPFFVYDMLTWTWGSKRVFVFALFCKCRLLRAFLSSDVSSTLSSSAWPWGWKPVTWQG